MPFDFPNSPTVGQRVTGVGGIVYVWDGVKWASNVGNVTAQSMGDVGRNLLHNGLFNIAQRGSGPFGANTTGWTYSLDRWMLIIAAAGDTLSHTPTAMADAYRTQIGDESAATGNACNFVGGAGAANTCLSGQFIEGVRRLAGKTVIVSFYALAAGTSLKLGVSLDQFFGTGGSPSATVTGVGQSVTVSSTTWARYSLTFTLPSISGKTLGTAGNDQTSLLFWHSAGANSATRSGNVGVQTGTHLIWGVQLELGSVATPIEKLDPRMDLANCQRFYQGGIGIEVLGAAYTPGAYVSTMMTLAVTMRALPTLTPAWTTQLNTMSPAVLPLTSYGFLAYVQGAAAGTVTLVGGTNASADL